MHKDLTSSLFLLAFSVFVCAGGIYLKLRSFHRPDPEFFLFLAGLRDPFLDHSDKFI